MAPKAKSKQNMKKKLAVVKVRKKPAARQDIPKKKLLKKKLLKKPSNAGMAALKDTEDDALNGSSSLGSEPSYHDNKAFKLSLMKEDCPNAVKEEVSRIMSLGYGQNKQAQLKDCIINWKMHGWCAPIFMEKVEQMRKKSHKVQNEPMPWARLVKKYNSDENAAKEAVQDGEVMSVPNPVVSGGKPWWKMVRVTVSDESSMSRSHQLKHDQVLLGSEDHVQGVLNEVAAGLADMEAKTFDLGSVAADIPGPPVNATRAAAIEDDNLGDVIDKVTAAAKNISALILKINEWEAIEATLGGQKLALLKAHVFSQKDMLKGLQDEYYYMIQHRKIKDEPQTTAVKVKKKILDDTKVVQNIMLRLRAASTLPDDMPSPKA